MKKIFTCCVLAILFFMLSPTVFAAETGQAIAAVTESNVNEAPARQTQETLPEAWTEITEDAPMSAEEFSTFSLSDMFDKLLTMAKDNWLEPIRLFARLCGILILTATVRGLASENAQSDILSLLDTVAALAIFSLCSRQMLGLLQMMQTALEESRAYLACFVPVFASVMISCGQTGTALVYSGMFFGVATITANVLCAVGLPLTRVLIALHATASVDSTVDLTQLAKSVTKWIKWLLTFVATVFATVLGLQSALAQSADSAALKAGKFLIGSSVPVVGRAVSDAMGSVFAGLKLIKGTVGFAAVSVIAATFLPILLQCVVFHAVFTFGSIVANALGSQRSGKLLDGFAQCVSLYITMALFFSIMVISTTLVMIVLGSGG